jgi:hypothetical protein
MIVPLASREFAAGAPVRISVRVADDELPDAVNLWVRPAGARAFGKPVAMQRVHGNDYAAGAGVLAPGLYEYAVSATTGTRTTTFPGAVPEQPGEWPYFSDSVWTFRVTPAGLPLGLFNAKADYPLLSFVRPHETVRNGLFRIVPGRDANEAALSFGVPNLGADTPDLYVASLAIGDAIAARRADAPRATSLNVVLRSDTDTPLDVSLIEKDGAAWKATVVADRNWRKVSVPLNRLRIARSILIPSPFPGLWDYWREIPAHRGGRQDTIHLADVERLELTVHRGKGASGAEVQSVWLGFASSARNP